MDNLQRKHLRLGTTKFLKLVLMQQIDQSDQTEDLGKIVEKGIQLFGDSPEESTMLLTQRLQSENDDVFAAQQAFFLLCYIAFFNGNIFIPIPTLFPPLISFLNYNLNVVTLPSLTLKHLTFLVAVMSVQCQAGCIQTENLKQANKLLLMCLSAHGNLSYFCIRHVIFLQWSFWSDHHARLFGELMVSDWLNLCCHSSENSSVHLTNATSSEVQLLVSLICTNSLAKQQFLNCLLSQDSQVMNQAIMFLKQISAHSSYAENLEIQELKHYFAKSIPPLLIKMLFHRKQEIQQIDTLIVGVLELLCWLRKTDSSLGSEVEPKLVYQVCSYLSEHYYSVPCSDVALTILKYLHSSLQTSKSMGDAQVLSIIISNDQILGLIEEVINCQFEFVPIATILSLLSSMVSCQMHYRIKYLRRIGITAKHLCHWMQLPELELSCICISSVVFQFPKEAMIYIYTSETTSSGDLPLLATKLSDDDLRILFLHLQNSLIRNTKETSQDITECFISFMNFVKEQNVIMYRHLWNQPWLAVMLKIKVHELSLEDINSNILHLLLYVFKHQENSKFHSTAAYIAEQLSNIMTNSPNWRTKYPEIQELVNTLSKDPYKITFAVDIPSVLPPIQVDGKDSSTSDQSFVIPSPEQCDNVTGVGCQLVKSRIQKKRSTKNRKKQDKQK